MAFIYNTNVYTKTNETNHYIRSNNPTHKSVHVTKNEVCTANGTLTSLRFHPDKEHERWAFADITEDLEESFVTDAGYLLKKSELKSIFDSNRKPCVAKKKNMNRILTHEQFQLLLNRNRIKNVWSVMKLNYNLIYHRTRSVNGIFRQFFYSISAFLLHLADDAKQCFLPNCPIGTKLEF